MKFVPGQRVVLNQKAVDHWGWRNWYNDRTVFFVREVERTLYRGDYEIICRLAFNKDDAPIAYVLEEEIDPIDCDWKEEDLL